MNQNFKFIQEISSRKQRRFDFESKCGSWLYEAEREHVTPEDSSRKEFERTSMIYQRHMPANSFATVFVLFRGVHGYTVYASVTSLPQRPDAHRRQNRAKKAAPSHTLIDSNAKRQRIV